MYGLNPFSAQNATNDPSHTPSIFGALPYPESSASPHTLVTLRFTALSPTVLDCKVVGASHETYYRVVTNGQAYTLLKDCAGRDIAAVGWATHPTVDAQSIGGKLPVGRWLQLSSDKSARTMVHGEVRYVWAPFDRFLHLVTAGTSEWLARITKTADAVVLELTPRAIERGLMDTAVLATLLLLSGKKID